MSWTELDRVQHRPIEVQWNTPIIYYPGGLQIHQAHNLLFCPQAPAQTIIIRVVERLAIRLPQLHSKLRLIITREDLKGAIASVLSVPSTFHSIMPTPVAKETSQKGGPRSVQSNLWQTDVHGRSFELCSYYM